MKNDIDLTFARLARQKKKGLIAYLSAGYPSFPEQSQLIPKLRQAGVDILELGVPFSDPIADGPTIQWSSFQSLKKGTTLKKILLFVKKIQKHHPLPIVLMSYLNPIFHYGYQKFAREACAAGVSGLIVPDLNPEEGRDLEKILRHQGIHMIYLVAPTSTPFRQKIIAKRSRGFLYAVSVRGVTGSRSAFPNETVLWLKKLKRKSPQPLCIGFGISKPHHIRQLKPAVHGFIVGSALIERLKSGSSNQRTVKAVRFIKSLAKECSYGPPQ